MRVWGRELSGGYAPAVSTRVFQQDSPGILPQPVVLAVVFLPRLAQLLDHSSQVSLPYQARQPLSAERRIAHEKTIHVPDLHLTLRNLRIPNIAAANHHSKALDVITTDATPQRALTCFWKSSTDIAGAVHLAEIAACSGDSSQSV